MTKKQTPLPPRELVMNALRVKSCMKQDVYHSTVEMFAELKEVLQEIATDLDQGAQEHDKRLSVAYVDKGATACELKVAGDVITGDDRVGHRSSFRGRPRETPRRVVTSGSRSRGSR